MIKIVVKNFISEGFKDYGYDFSKEKSPVKFSVQQMANSDDKVQNIINVYNQADDDTKDFYKNWYIHIQQVVKKISEKYNIEFELAAAVYAVLSPGNRTSSNIDATEKAIENFLNDRTKDHPEYKRIQANNIRNAVKALEILKTKSLNLVTGPKVVEFFNSILNPNISKGRLVLDGHAINIWNGKKTGIKGVSVSSAQRTKIIDDYKEAAKRLGVSLQELQAVTWFVWKNSR